MHSTDSTKPLLPAGPNDGDDVKYSMCQIRVYFPPFQDWEHRQEEDRLLIERLLIVIRNVLHVPTDPEAEQVSMAVSNLLNSPLLLQKFVDSFLGALRP